MFDIGANRGQMALYFARLTGNQGAVYAFEPVPTVYENLRENLSLNSFENVETFCAALADRPGKVKFEFSEEHSTQGKIGAVEDSYHVDGAQTIEVDCLVLDDFSDRLTDSANVYVKIDVEGAAGSVLKGGLKFIERHRPTLYIELHGPDEFASLKILRDLGYQFVDVESGEFVDPSSRWVSPVGCLPKLP